MIGDDGDAVLFPHSDIGVVVVVVSLLDMLVVVPVFVLGSSNDCFLLEPAATAATIATDSFLSSSVFTIVSFVAVVPSTAFSAPCPPPSSSPGTVTVGGAATNAQDEDGEDNEIGSGLDDDELSVGSKVVAATSTTGIFVVVVGIDVVVGIFVVGVVIVLVGVGGVASVPLSTISPFTPSSSSAPPSTRSSSPPAVVVSCCCCVPVVLLEIDSILVRFVVVVVRRWMLDVLIK